MGNATTSAAPPPAPEILSLPHNSERHVAQLEVEGLDFYVTDTDPVAVGTTTVGSNRIGKDNGAIVSAFAANSTISCVPQSNQNAAFVYTVRVTPDLPDTDPRKQQVYFFAQCDTHPSDLPPNSGNDSGSGESSSVIVASGDEEKSDEL